MLVIETAYSIAKVGPHGHTACPNDGAIFVAPDNADIAPDDAAAFAGSTAGGRFRTLADEPDSWTVSFVAIDSGSTTASPPPTTGGNGAETPVGVDPNSDVPVVPLLH